MKRPRCHLQGVDISESRVLPGQHEAGLDERLVGWEPGQDLWWHGAEHQDGRQVQVPHQGPAQGSRVIILKEK